MTESPPTSINLERAAHKKLHTLATWDRVKPCEVTLPVASDGNINFDYMERYIRVIEKLTITNIVKYKDKMIATTRKVVAG